VSALIIVDTDILIDAAWQVSEAVNCLDSIEQKSAAGCSCCRTLAWAYGMETDEAARYLDRQWKGGVYRKKM